MERTQGKASGQGEGNFVIMTKSGSRTDSRLSAVPRVQLLKG